MKAGWGSCVVLVHAWELKLGGMLCGSQASQLPVRCLGTGCREGEGARVATGNLHLGTRRQISMEAEGKLF